MRRTTPIFLFLLLFTAGATADAGRVSKARPALKEGSLLVIVRHGESTANKKGIWAGRNVKAPLTRRGRGQALRAGRLLRGIRFDRAYSSTIDRAIKTQKLALTAAGQRSIPTAQTSALDERSYGIIEGLTKDEGVRTFGEERIRTWRLSRKEGPPGGESLDDVADRAVGFLDRSVLPKLAAGENVLLTTHRHTIRALVGHLEGLSEKELESLEPANAEPLVYRVGANGKLTRVTDRIDTKPAPRDLPRR